MAASGLLQPSSALPTDGSLSPDSCRARRMLLTAESAKSNRSGRAIQTSEIGFLRHRHMIVEEIRIVLSADLFIGLLLHAPIAPHSGPRFVEDVRVLDSEDDFHRVAPVDHSPTLHDMQFLGVRGAVDVDDRLVIQADRVDDKSCLLRNGRQIRHTTTAAGLANGVHPCKSAGPDYPPSRQSRPPSAFAGIREGPARHSP